MIVYSVTVGIDRDIEQEWLAWIKSEYIPAVMQTGMFVENKLFKVLGQEEEETVSYSLQYFARNIDRVNEYLNKYAPSLTAVHHRRYENKHVAFRTLLEQVG